MLSERPEKAPSPTQGRMDCFESIRGLAAFAVLLGHLVIAFWSGLYIAGAPAPGAHSSLIHMAARTPLRVLWEAQWAVSTFFVLSGFVLTLAYFRSGRQGTMSSAAVRRYFRLMIPAAASILFAYVLLKCGWMCNRAAAASLDGAKPSAHWWLNIFYNFKPSFRVALKDCFWTSFFGNGSLYNQNLWTMPVELQGSFLVYTFALLFGKLRNRWLIYTTVSFILVCTHQLFMLNFVLGTILADLFVWAEKRELRRGMPWPLAVLVVLGAVYLGTLRPTAPISIHGLKLDRMAVYQSIASFLLVGAVAFSPMLRRVLEIRVLRFLGGISFGLYLIHLPVLCSLGTGLFLATHNHLGWSYNAGALSAAAATIGTSILLAWAFHRWIDQPAVSVCKALYTKVFEARAAANPAPAAPALTRAA